MTTNRDLNIFQWGKETVRGTLVAATSRIAVPRIDFNPTDAVTRPRLAAGRIIRNPGNEFVVSRGMTFDVPEFPVFYEQQQNWLSMAVKGGVTGVGTAPTVWTFNRSMTADPAPDSWTLERRLTDGSTPKDAEWGYCLLRELSWRGASNEELRMAASGFGRRIQTSTLTPALSAPTVEGQPFNLTRVWQDTTWAGLGGTLISGQVLGFAINFHTGLLPVYTAEGRSDLDHTNYKVSSELTGLDVELTMFVGGQYDIERTAAAAQNGIALRIQHDGSAGRQMRWDMFLKAEKGDIYSVGEQDGQDIVVMRMVDSGADGTNFFECKVSNLVTTMV